MNIETHAYKVVSGFKKSLTPAQAQLLGDESLEELQMLIEAALGESVAMALHESVGELEALVKATRKRAGSIDSLEK